MGGDLPDYTRTITVLLQAEILSQVRQLPWWVRYNPSRVVFLDDMEGVLKWTQNSGTVAKESSIRAFEASNCLSLLTGAVAGNDARAEINLGAISRSKIGIQFRWNVFNGDSEALRYFDLYFIFVDGTGYDEIVLRYISRLNTIPTNKWQYYNENGALADIPGGDEEMEIDTLQHHHCYFTLDLRSPYNLCRLVTSALDLDLTSLKHYHDDTTAPPLIWMQFAVTTDKAVAVKAAVDAVLLSDEES